jgi:hypothetical protein
MTAAPKMVMPSRGGSSGQPVEPAEHAERLTDCLVGCGVERQQPWDSRTGQLRTPSLSRFAITLSGKQWED